MNRPPFETFKRPTCRGSLALGTHCGNCEKCEWERSQQAGAQMPASLATHQGKYREGAWEEYSFQELGSWVHLLATRATHRTDAAKCAKDLEDAQNYLHIMQAKLTALTARLWGHDLTKPLPGVKP